MIPQRKWLIWALWSHSKALSCLIWARKQKFTEIWWNQQKCKTEIIGRGYLKYRTGLRFRLIRIQTTEIGFCKATIVLFVRATENTQYSFWKWSEIRLFSLFCDVICLLRDVTGGVVIMSDVTWKSRVHNLDWHWQVILGQSLRINWAMNIIQKSFFE
jgi:hypothetical protein